MYELEEEEEEEEVDESEFPLSELLESNGFDQFFGTEQDKQMQMKKKSLINEHLSKLELQIEQSIRYDDHDKLVDLGAGEQVNINFRIEISKGIFYTPLMLCASLGHVECLKVLLKNLSLDIDALEEKSGSNAFWIAAYYGRGQCMSLLANANIDILNSTKGTQSNALHIAVQRKHYEIAKMLVKSGYPLNQLMKGGISALIVCAHDKDAFQVAASLVYAGADINQVAQFGQSALSEAIIHENRKLAELLIKKDAKMFFDNIKYRDLSPFYQAVNHNKQWAIELFCDHGADINTISSQGMNPLIYSATQGQDEICMYLSLRTQDINLEDKQTGQNIFTIYMLKKDVLRMHQLLMRGADINYLNKKTGMTHLRLAIEKEMPAKIVKWLLKSGANPHIVDYEGTDCCDVAGKKDIYKNIAALHTGECEIDPKLRVKPETIIEQLEARRALISELLTKVNFSKAQQQSKPRKDLPLIYEQLEDNDEDEDRSSGMGGKRISKQEAALKYVQQKVRNWADDRAAQKKEVDSAELRAQVSSATSNLNSDEINKFVYTDQGGSQQTQRTPLRQKSREQQIVPRD